MPETKSSGWFGVTRRRMATRIANGSAARAAVRPAAWTKRPARAQLAQEDVRVDEDVGLPHERREDAHAQERARLPALDEEEGQHHQEERGGVGHPVLVLEPAHGPLREADHQETGDAQGQGEAEVPQVKPQHEQEAEENGVRDQEEAGVHRQPETREPAHEGRDGEAEAVGRLLLELRPALGPLGHLDVAPVVVLLDLVRLVQEAQPRRHGQHVEAEDQDHEQHAESGIGRASHAPDRTADPGGLGAMAGPGRVC